MHITDFRTVVGASPTERRTGLVFRWSMAVALVETSDDGAVSELLDFQADEPPPQLIAQALRDAAAHTNVTALIGLVEAPGGPWVLLHGDVELHTQGETLRGATDSGERQLTAEQNAVHLALAQPSTPGVAAPLGAAISLSDGANQSAGDGSSAAEAPRAPQLLQLIDLQAGTVVSSTVSLVPRHRRIVAPPPLPDAEAPAADVQPFEFVDLQQLPAPIDAKPLALASSPESDNEVPKVRDPLSGDEVAVRGILCSRNHFNDPRAAFCMVCGISMVHVTHNLVEGTRPTLGFLVFDDGSTFTLDRSYVLGREPGVPGEPGVDGLLVPDPDRQSVSRRHAEIRLDGWFVNLIDLGSTNGSFTWSDTTQAWQSLPANQPISLSPGVTVALGRRTFIFESVHRI